MDRLIGTPRQDLGDLAAALALQPMQHLGGMLGDALADDAVPIDDLDRLSRREAALDRRDPDGKQRRATPAKHSAGAVVDHDPAPRGGRPTEPELEAGRPIVPPRERGSDLLATSGSEQRPGD